MNWFHKLKSKLVNTSTKIGAFLFNFRTSKLDIKSLEELKEIFISTDMGLKASSAIIEAIKKEKFNTDSINLVNASDKKTLSSPIDTDTTTQENTLQNFLLSHLTSILKKAEKNFSTQLEKYQSPDYQSPIVIMICGVNGNGKTTTIAKLASQFKAQGKRVVLGACDTFRAAAADQLTVWATRLDIPIIDGPHQSDPASVAYKALTFAKEQKSDILIIDTAGRLHNNTNLMDQLKKCHKVLSKIDKNAPHETILIIDGTTGQSAYRQIEAFSNIIPISGIIVTKLDSSAKGGIIVGIAQDFTIPVYAIGIGEGIDDLNDFSAEEFAAALIGADQNKDQSKIKHTYN